MFSKFKPCAFYTVPSHIKSMYERKKYLKKTLVSAIYSCCSLPHHILTKLLLECKLYKVLQNKTNSQHNTATQHNLHSFLYFIIRQKMRRRSKWSLHHLKYQKLALSVSQEIQYHLYFRKQQHQQQEVVDLPAAAVFQRHHKQIRQYWTDSHVAGHNPSCHNSFIRK